MVADVCITLVVHHDEDKVRGPGPFRLLRDNAAVRRIVITQAADNHQEKDTAGPCPHLQSIYSSEFACDLFSAQSAVNKCQAGSLLRVEMGCFLARGARPKVLSENELTSFCRLFPIFRVGACGCGGGRKTAVSQMGTTAVEVCLVRGRPDLSQCFATFRSVFRRLKDRWEVPR